MSPGIFDQPSDARLGDMGELDLETEEAPPRVHPSDGERVLSTSLALSARTMAARAPSSGQNQPLVPVDEFADSVQVAGMDSGLSDHVEHDLGQVV